MPEHAHVYILASSFKRLYIGVTTALETRIWQHKQRIHPNSFTSRYRIDQLVYLERYTLVTTAIAREKQLKRWSRIKKLRLIVGQNPTWQDLSAEWGKPLKLGVDLIPYSGEGEEQATTEYGGLSTPLRSGRDDEILGGSDPMTE